MASAWTTLRPVALVALACFLPGTVLRADEAILADGSRLSGTLTLDSGRLRFLLAKSPKSLALDQLAYVRFPTANAAPFRIAAPFRVMLRDGEFLSGEFRGLDEKSVLFRTAWADRVTLPRSAVAAVGHAPGLVTIVQDDFEDGLKAWKLKGAPGLTQQQHVSGTHSLRLDAVGQAAEYLLANPIAVGQVGINFVADKPAGARWLFEAEFAGPKTTQTVQVILAGPPSSYGATVNGTEVGHLRPTPGWHRLSVKFTATSLLLTVDDEVLWSGRRREGGSLQKVRLACVAAGDQPAGGAVCFDDFGLAQAVASRMHPQGDPGQDELWLLPGDQLFGQVPRANPRTIQLQGRLGNRAINWAAVRGVYFRKPSPASTQTRTARVRIWLRSGIGVEPDVLEGVVQTLDQRRLLLRHALLGEVEIERKRVHRLRWLPGKESEAIP
jgi:hypothetical protein